jgi:phospholipase/carboxylesterase
MASDGTTTNDFPVAEAPVGGIIEATRQGLLGCRRLGERRATLTRVRTWTTRISRRRFTKTAGCALASMAFADACSAKTESAGNGALLTVRPSNDAVTSLESGPLGLGGRRDGVLQIPPAAANGKVPLLVFLHGATQNGALMLQRIGPAAAAAGVAVLAPDSRDTTWDAIRGDFGDDVAFLNRAIDHVFKRLAVDPACVVVGGFSDGASYALSLGLANGDLFRRIVAFSPGFLIDTPVQGRPRVFVAHGTSDQILPIDRCSRVIVRRLRSLGYDVTFREFDGRHEVTPAIAGEGLAWMTNG